MAKSLDIHSGGFKPNFSSHYADVDCPLFADGAVLSNVIWPAKKVMHPESKDPLKKSKKCSVTEYGRPAVLSI